MSTEIVLKLGERGEDFAKKNAGLVKVEKQPAGLNFYSIAFNGKPLGRVLLENGKSSLNIAHVLSVLSSEDIDAQGPSSSFQEISVNAGISSDELISHDSARLAFYAMLHDATARGWRPFVSESDPRIFGKARLDYALKRDSTIGLDDAYVPTLEEWMRIQDSTAWLFHADNAFLEVTFQRDHARLEPTQPGAYLLTFTFKTDIERFLSDARPEQRQNWKQLLPEALAAAAKDRSRIESELEAAGTPVNDAYRDPAPPL